MSQVMNTESLGRLIEEVKKYKTTLNNNIRILENASNACDQAMGSDEISKKYISELDTAIVQLKEAEKLVEEVIKELKKDKEEAENIL